MKTKLFKIAATAVLTAFVGKMAISQVNPTPRTLPFYETFGATTFTNLPIGFGTGMVSGAPVSTQSAAQSSTLSATASLAPATAIQTNGGSYGYAASNDAKFYVQHSSSTSTGTNQLVMSINTLYWHNTLISYNVEMLNANPKTAGLVLQYRVGTSGAWTTIAGSTYSHNNTSRTNGQIDTYTNLSLPAATDNQPVVQLRWASWRGTQTGNSSGVAVDNVSVSSSPQGLPTNVSASTASSCSQLFLSELVSDTTGNIGVEVYNPTASGISLSGYYLSVSNGTNTPSYYPLSGTISSYSTYVVVNGKSPSAALRAKANLLNGISYNYNQIIGLVYSTNPLVSVVMIDMIGDPSGTPSANGWQVSSFGDTAYTKNSDLTRLITVSNGNLKWAGSAQHEYYPHPMGTYSFLGWHTSICNVDSLPTANMVAPTYSTSIEALLANSCVPNTDPVTMSIKLVGGSGGVSTPGWQSPVVVYYNDNVQYGYNGLTGLNPPNCRTPIAGSSDYSYSANNYVVFAPSSSGSTVTQAFSFDVSCTQAGGDININGGTITGQVGPNFVWACFFVDYNPAYSGPPFQPYNIGNNYESDLFISNLALDVGIQTLFDNKQIKVFPNPFNDQVTIENTSQTPITKVTVCDLLGREIISSNPNQLGTLTINTQGFDKGVYFIKVYNNSDSFTVKQIKE